MCGGAAVQGKDASLGLTKHSDSKDLQPALGRSLPRRTRTWLASRHVKVVQQSIPQSGNSLGTIRWGPYQTDVGSALGLKASCPIGCNISCNNSNDIASRVLERDMPNTWVITLRKPKVCHPHQTIIILPVQVQFTNRGNFYLKWCCLVI